MSRARFVVGIDLGTTHTVVASAAIDASNRPEIVPIEQQIASNAVEARGVLPSYLFAPIDAAERLAIDGDEPDDAARWIVGEHARARGAEAPGRVVASSKSWLAHAGVDRDAPILPWGDANEGDEERPRISPVDAAAMLLRRVRASWDRAHPADRLVEQRVVLTLPASFDEGARALTIEATRRAGLVDRDGAPVVRLLEEPQAALQDWLAASGDAALDRLLGDEREREIVVCDVGGGTSDFALVRITRDADAPGGIDIARVAVGDHLLLGGDNIDIAIARAVEPAIAGGAGLLGPARFAQLVAACRIAKEQMLSRDLASITVTLLGGGARLIGGSARATLEHTQLDAILDAFLPLASRADAHSASPKRRAGLVAIGLPYASDAAITRHFARFLSRQSRAFAEHRSVALLLNGGVFNARAIVDRLVSSVDLLVGAPTTLLPVASDAPDLAVARGAVAYGLALEGHGRRVGGGAARGLFVVVVDHRDEAIEGAHDRPLTAVCVLPKGATAGRRFVAEGRSFAVTTGASARFQIFSTTGDRAHADARPGDVATIDDRFEALPPLVVALERRGVGPAEIEVSIAAELSEIGTADLALVTVDGSRTDRLSFELRARDDRPAPTLRVGSTRPSDRRLDDALARIEQVFGKARSDVDARQAKSLQRNLEKSLGPRESWPIATLRPLFDALIEGVAARRRTPDHERTFWSLAGYLLRPGFGDPLDDSRSRKLAPLVSELLSFPREDAGWRAFWVAWRRVAGGISEATQLSLRDLLDPFVEPDDSNGRRARKKPKGVRPEPLDEVWRLLGALERVPIDRKTSLGAWVLERTWTSRDPWLYATLGRIGARVPAYASAHQVVSPRIAEGWLADVLRVDWREIDTAAFAATQLARMTGDRAIDVRSELRTQTIDRLTRHGARPDWIASVGEIVADEATRTRDVFGDDWPIGLRLLR